MRYRKFSFLKFLFYSLMTLLGVCTPGYSTNSKCNLADNAFAANLEHVLQHSELNAYELVQHVFNRLGYGTNSADQRIQGLVKYNSAGGLDRASTIKALVTFIKNGLNERTRVDPQIESMLAKLYPLATLSYDDIIASLRNKSLAYQENPTAENKLALDDYLHNVRALTLARQMAYMTFGRNPIYLTQQMFWFNHFSVSFEKGNFDLADYVEMIGNHQCGQFEDLVIAVAQHPAMLKFLDGAYNRTGFIYDAGQKKYNITIPPNENFAREVMELHTLGRGPKVTATDDSTPYDQNDVQQVALLLSGWNLQGGLGEKWVKREFIFHPTNNVPISKTIMGKTYGTGEEAGEEFLRDLAKHPRTQKFIVGKLIHRFVSEDSIPDSPSSEWEVELQSLRSEMIHTWQSTHGSLSSVFMSMLVHPSFWTKEAYRTKVKTPVQYVVSANRASGLQPETVKLSNGETQLDQAFRVASEMGESLFFCTIPTGYDDLSAVWATSALPAAALRFSFGVADFQGDPSSQRAKDYQTWERFAAGDNGQSIEVIKHAALNGFNWIYDFGGLSKGDFDLGAAAGSARFQFPASYWHQPGFFTALALNPDRVGGAKRPLRSIFGLAAGSADFLKY